MDTEQEKKDKCFTAKSMITKPIDESYKERLSEWEDEDVEEL